MFWRLQQISGFRKAEPAPDGHRRAAVAGFLAMVLLALRTPAAAADEPIVQGAAPAPAQAAAGQSGGADPSVVRPFDDRRTAGSFNQS